MNKETGINSALDLKQMVQLLAKNNDQEHLLPLLRGTIFYKTAIEAAAKSGHSQLVDSLLKEMGINGTSYTAAQMALLNCALSGYTQGLHFEEVKFLVAKGANIFHGLNALTSTGQLSNQNGLQLLACAKQGSEQEEKLRNQLQHVYSITDEETPPLQVNK